MERFEKILFVSQSGAVDGPSLERIFALARSGGASVTLAGVVEYSAADFGAIPQGVAPQQLLQLLADERRDQLERLCAAAPPGVRSEVVVLNGIPYLEIIRKVLRDGHDLVVKPVVQEIGLRARLFGSLDLHLLRKCPVPLWLMRPAAAGGPERVLAAVDMGHDSDGVTPDPLSLKILDLAASLAGLSRSELHVVHAWEALAERALRGGRGGCSLDEVEKYVANEQRRHRQWLDEVCRVGIRQRAGELIPQLHMPRGWGQDQIPQLAQALGAWLVVMGSVARTGIPGFIIGNTAEMIINDLDCSVLAVKPEGFVTPVTLEG